MNRDEYLARLETEPATPNQRGAIMRECRRLGIRDRAERLATCSALLGIDALGSTADLPQGQAGQLVNVLQRAASRAALFPGAAPRIVSAQAAGHHGQDHDARPKPDRPAEGEQVTWPRILARIVVGICVAVLRDA